MSIDRQPLTRERILTAAVGLADEGGVAGLSMRGLARHLGFEVMSLYNHVANKDDLLEGMVDLVAAEIEPPADGIEWKAGVRELALSTRAMMLRHPWVCELWTRVFPGQVRFARMESLLALLERGGFDGEIGDLAFHAVNMHVNGFTQQQLGYSSAATSLEEQADRFDAEVTAEEFPLMVEHKRYHDEVEAEVRHAPDEFVFVLDLVLDGLERARDGGGDRRPDAP